MRIARAISTVALAILLWDRGPRSPVGPRRSSRRATTSTAAPAMPTISRGRSPGTDTRASSWRSGPPAAASPRSTQGAAGSPARWIRPARSSRTGGSPGRARTRTRTCAVGRGHRVVQQPV